MARIPSKVVIYGQQGVGKSYLASTFSNPIFFDVENGLRFLPNISKVKVKTYSDFTRLMVKLLKSEKKYDTVVIDSIDWLMALIIADVAGSGGSTYQERLNNSTNTLNKSNGGYGNGKQVLANNVHDILLSLFDELIDMGYTVVLTAHATKKTITAQDGSSIQQMAPKIDDNTMSTFAEWADHIFYLTDQDGKRSLRVSPDYNILAKNRLGLEGDVPVEGLDIEKLLDPDTARKVADETIKSNKENN